MTGRRAAIAIIASPAFILVGIIAAVAVVAPPLAPYDALATSANVLQPPSVEHWFGTDSVGRDIFSRVLVSTRLDLGIAASAVSVAFLIGTTFGALAGYYGGWTDRVIGRLVDTIMAFPLFVLAMGIVAALGNSIENVVYATIIINLPFYIRFARGEVNARRNIAYVEAARASGNNDFQIIALHIVPNIMPAMMVQISLNMGWAIMNAASLSFVGLGVRPPLPEWGIMVFEGASNIISGEWWTFVFPGAALMLAIACFDLLGESLRLRMDPRSAR
ncbi:peptide ABC transporter permease [Agrobacterium arsenijevicii]|uniref:Peptide ABC transporter permease n=1 Tax=Agrobacterium arsenijevicii TaxID=1585697 RepID=A0ABR5D0P1_9HYPH|nr:peptide ABC transporter permease [Agrobacterium arsenijevicii]